jgi:hypothetical protein
VWLLGTAESNGLQHGQLTEYFENKNVICCAQLNEYKVFARKKAKLNIKFLLETK